ncbi:putative ribonuclease H-like domain-containing protein [Tanacetum coccineum]
MLQSPPVRRALSSRLRLQHLKKHDMVFPECIGTKAYQDAGKARMDKVPKKEYILLPLWVANPQDYSQPKTFPKDKDDEKDDDQQGDQGQKENDARVYQEEVVNSINILNTNNAKEVNTAGEKAGLELLHDPDMPEVEDIIYSNEDDNVGAKADITNMDTNIPISPIPTTRIHKDHPLDQVIGDVHLVTQTRRMSKNFDEHGLVWTLVDLPNGKRAIGTKWVYRNKKDERGIVVRNKARLVPQDSDYGGASLDRKSTTGGCQFLGKRLISWQCKKQPIVANSTTEAEYVAAGNCCGQNPVFHSKTKHIEIRHQFIRDSYEKRLIEVLKIHTDHNVADLLTKGFDVSSEPINLVIFEAVFEEMYDSVESAGTTATSLEAEQDSCGRPKCQEAMGGIHAQTRLMLVVYVSHITQFWTTTQVKKVDGVAEIQALVDGKQIVVFEASIRRLLKFNDEGGMDCLPNCLSAKTTAWNEFSSITASSIICLSTNQQFNFSKFILEGMIRNLDAKAAKFLMYPRFVQLFVNQLEGLPEHHRQYKVPYHTKKIFANMKRKNNDFSGTVTPSFPTMVVQPPSSPPPTTSTTPTPIPTPPEPTLIPTTPAPTLTTTPPPTPTTITKSLPQTSTQSSQPSKQRIRR